MDSNNNLRVMLLGNFSMTYYGEPLELKKKQTAKPIQLLMLLLSSREQGVSRQSVVEALYGDTDEDVTNTLNATVSQLRRILRESGLPDENYVRIRFDRYYFVSSFPVWCDVEEVERMRQRADIMYGKDRIGVLYRLCGQYQGRFLSGLDGIEWIEVRRAYYQRLFRESMMEICQDLEERQAFSELQRMSDLASHIFPFDEWQVWQQSSLLAQGRVADAQALYQQVEQLYLAQLDAQPPEEMRQGMAGDTHWREATRMEAVLDWLEQERMSGPYRIPNAMLLQEWSYLEQLSRGGNLPLSVLLLSLPESKLPQQMEQLEAILTRQLRPWDVYTHLTRTQFLVLLWNTTREEASQLGEALKQAQGGRLTVVCRER